MWSKNHLSICALCCLLLAAYPALADPVGLVVEDSQSLGLSVCKVYAIFDYYADELLGIAYSDIQTDDPAGFYQHAQGGDTAPDASLCGSTPELCLDSYVTIGVDDSSGGDDTALSPDWDSRMFNIGGQTVGDWYNFNPDNSQGIAGADLRVLIGQFTRSPGHSVTGTLSVFYNDGLTGFPASFACFGLGQESAGPFVDGPTGEPTIWYVNDDGSEGNGCTSWGDACPELQTALNLAEEFANNQIWVAEGTYLPDFDVAEGAHTGDRDLSFVIPDTVQVYGGFFGDEESIEERDEALFESTVLSGDIGEPLNPSDNAYHVVDISSKRDVVLDGFKVTLGNASSGAVPSGNGGGLLGGNVIGADIRNCTFTENKSACTGAGAAVSNYDIFIIDCKFVGNESAVGGGGLRLSATDSEVRGCLFQGNTVKDEMGVLVGAGGGLMMSRISGTLLVEESQFEANQALDGAGVAVEGDVPFINNVFIENVTGAGGKGSAILRGCSSGNATNCLFAGNSSTALDSTYPCIIVGSGLECSLTCTDCTGGGVPSVDFAVTNSTFVANATVSHVVVGQLELDGSVLWDNASAVSVEPNAGCVVGYSDIQGGLPGACNADGVVINVNPSFVDAPNDNYRLASGSICIDHGNNASPGLVGIMTDLDGNLRFVDDLGTLDCSQAPGTCGDAPVVDMGAYEFQGCNTNCPGDFNFDNQVAIEDLLLVLGAWGPCPPECALHDPGSCACPGNLEPGCDGVTILDLLGVLGNWGPC